MRLALPFLFLALVLAGCSDSDGGSDPTPTAGPSPTSPPPAAPGSPPTTPPGIAPMPDNVTLEVAAVGTYPIDPAFDPETLMVPAGAMVTVVFHNDDKNPLIDHNWVVEGIDGAASDVVSPGEDATLTFEAPLEPGEHTYFCSIGDHRARGMEGTLSVAVS